MRAGSKNLGLFVEASLRPRLKRLSSNLRNTEKRPEDADQIHDLRVAIRRFTQGLRIFKHLLKSSDVRKMRRRLRPVMSLCGTIRNCDIAHDVLRASHAAIPEDLQQRLARTRSAAGSDLTDLLQDSNLAQKTRDWDKWLRAEASPNQTITSTARRILIPLTKEFMEAGAGAANPESTPLEMHRFRLQGKRLRYTLEIFGPIVGPQWKQWIKRVRDLQEQLGAINDCVTTRDLIADPSGPSEDLLAAESALERLLKERIETFREYWNKHLGPQGRSSWLAQVEKIGRTA